MSDNGYDDDGFENYDDDDFEAPGEEEEQDDYDVLPTTNMSKGATPVLPSTPKEVASPQRGPLRASYAGAGPSTGGGGILHSRPTASVDIPSFAGLTDAQRRSAVKKLAGAILRRKKVQLQVVEMEDFPPMASLRLYDLFKMRRSVYGNVGPGATQTHDDDKAEEVQTDEIYRRTCDCQVPEDRNTVFEGEHTLAAGSGKGSGAGGGGGGGGGSGAVMRITAMAPDQESKLLGFMRWAGPIMLAALGMNPTVKKLAIKGGAATDLSAGSARLLQEGLLAHRPTTCLALCPGPAPLLLVAYAPVGAQLGAAQLLQDHSLNSKGVLCTWDLSAPSAPAAVMVSEGSPACCAWAPAPSTSLVFAGMEEGGVCAWDLDEPDTRHPLEKVSNTSLYTRRPAYTTEYMADVATSAAPVVGIATIPRTESRQRPCQVVALNGWGVVTVYTAALLALADTGAADADIGLRPGSRLRLIKTTQLTRLGLRAMKPVMGPKGGGGGGPLPPPEPVRLDQSVQTFSLALLPAADMQLLAGGEAGRVLRGSLVGTPPAPKEFVPDDFRSPLAVCPTTATPTPSHVTALAVSPFIPTLFLSGHDHGLITLHELGCSAAVATWPDVSRGRILAVRWSPVKPSVFYALDSLCTLFTFDLAGSRTAPVASQSMVTMDKGKSVASLPTSLDVGLAHTGEEARDAAAARAAGKAPAAAAADGGAQDGSKGGAWAPKPPTGTPVLVVGYDDGLVDVHLLAARQVTAAPEDMVVLQATVAGAAAAVAKAAKK